MSHGYEVFDIDELRTNDYSKCQVIAAWYQFKYDVTQKEVYAQGCDPYHWMHEDAGIFQGIYDAVMLIANTGV